MVSGLVRDGVVSWGGTTVGMGRLVTVYEDQLIVEY